MGSRLIVTLILTEAKGKGFRILGSHQRISKGKRGLLNKLDGKKEVKNGHS